MSVRAYNERRKAYRKTQGAVSNPGQPSPTNRAARRQEKRITALAAFLAATAPDDPNDLNPPLQRDCGQRLPGHEPEARG